MNATLTTISKEQQQKKLPLFYFTEKSNMLCFGICKSIYSLPDFHYNNKINAYVSMTEMRTQIHNVCHPTGALD